MNLVTIWNHLKNAESAAKPVVEAAVAAYNPAIPAVEQIEAHACMEVHNAGLSALRTAVMYFEKAMGKEATSAAKNAFSAQQTAAAAETAAEATASTN